MFANIRKCYHSVRVTLQAIVVGLVVLGVAAHAAAQSPAVVRVDGLNGSLTTDIPPPDGSAWGSVAYRRLQDALDQADALLDLPDPPPSVQVWVRGATDGSIIYRPDLGATVTLNEEIETIELKNNVGIYGGFAGTEGPFDFNLRNPLLYLTVISGEINNAGLSDNTYHIITSIRNDATAVIDGFTIRDGNANNSGLSDPDHRVGGGALILGLTAPDPTETSIDSCKPAIVRCKFINNRARFGGAVYVHVAQQSVPLVANCEFRDNLALKGGAACTSKASKAHS